MLLRCEPWLAVTAPEVLEPIMRDLGTCCFSVRRDCLAWLLIARPRQLERVLRVYVDHYNRHRPHRALELTAPIPGWRTHLARSHPSRSTDATDSADLCTNTPERHDVRIAYPRACDPSFYAARRLNVQEAQ
jgi:hypothetical protein